ncbi:MAG: hypothetical protein HXS50_02175 [Theionarchaea archaeon]|nr:hypothetical protein [Theionarchaea archaeon]
MLPDNDSDLFSFPVDEGRHPGCGQEWWYLQSHLNSGNRHFAFILCYFISQIKISALVDIDNQRFHFGISQEKDGDIETTEGYLELSKGGSWWREEGTFSYRLHEEIEEKSGGLPTVDLRLSSLKRPVPISGGRVKMGRNGYSYWYAQTRIEAGGEVALNGEQEEVQGVAWIDRQWGDWNRMGFGGWKWFSMHLEDQREVAICTTFEPISGRHLLSFCQIIEPDGSFRLAKYPVVRDIGIWTSPKNWLYSSGWHISCKPLDFEAVLTPSVANQEFYDGLWEGSCSTEIKIGGEQIPGVAFAEINLGKYAPFMIKYLSYVKAIGMGTLDRLRR